LPIEPAASNRQPETSFIETFIRPFDLSRAPLIRVGLIKTGKESHLLITDIHHIITDGVSNNILTKDFMTLYRGEELPGLYLQYTDFSEWQNSLVISGEIERRMNYWLNVFAGEIPVLNLQTDFPRPEVHTGCFKCIVIEIHGTGRYRDRIAQFRTDTFRPGKYHRYVCGATGNEKSARGR
jgi:hypothetical protein